MRKKEEEKLNINTLAGGAIEEAISFALDEVFENIKDPNTEAEKIRKLTVTLKLKPDETRQIIKTEINCKPTLVPTKSIVTQLLLDREGNNIVAKELLKNDQNQIDIDEFINETENTNSNMVLLEKEAK